MSDGAGCRTAPVGIASGRWLARPEAGSRLALWLIQAIGLHLGRPVARALLYPITLYFYLRRGAERRAVRVYLRRLDGGRRGTWRSLSVFHAYAATILDRIFQLARGLDGFDVRLHGEAELLRQAARGRGVLLLGAHIGSFDVLRALSARHPDYPLRLVMDRARTPKLTALLESLAPQLASDVLDTARGGPEIVLALADAARTGAMLALLGDRARPGEEVRAVPFLGTSAPLPTAPWRIAAALGVPVVLCVGLYEGRNRYRLVFETLAERVRLPRDDGGRALSAYMSRYAERIERHLRSAPRNWFNFYDFWEAPGAVRSADAAPRRPARAPIA